MIQKEITAIESGTYQGYIWKSNSNTPEVYNHKECEGIALNDEENPFIIEAQLYDEKKDVSYSVKYVDGKYIARQYSDLIDDSLGQNKPITYLGNQMSKDLKLKFRQYWEGKEDELCEGMKVLRPTSMVFVGFDYEEE